VPGRYFFHKPARRPFSERTHHLLKQGLASRFGADRNGYTEAKSAFVRSVLEKAEMETASERDTAHYSTSLHSAME
jgi:GrpB-like predicted nucleotidyltransferase (UPF0157 family)